MKKFIRIVVLTFTIIIGFVFYGLYLMANEDKYGNLVYVKDKAEDGDLILKCSFDYRNTNESVFDQIGIIKKSFGKVYVLVNKNASKTALYDWCPKQNGQKIIILRAKRNVKNENIPKINGKYNYLLKSTDYKKIYQTL